jgi:DNA-binding response OmpR family regulator
VPVAAPRLLIVDDDRGLRETLREIFAPEFTTLAVASGEEAVEAAREFAVDIAVVDVHMRVLTGIETVRRIKTLYTAAPCILITSDTSEQIRIEAQSVRAYTVLAKPLRLRTLSATVTAAFRQAYPQRRGG